VTRKARAEYTYTPEWQYWDLRKQALYLGLQGSGLGISVRTVSDKDGDDGGPLWKKIDILDMGEIWNILEDEIERRCKVEDAKRRRAASSRTSLSNFSECHRASSPRGFWVLPKCLVAEQVSALSREKRSRFSTRSGLWRNKGA
jgi:hypothetical protein